VFVALVIQHALHMRHIVIYGLSGSTIFFHIISQMAQILKTVIEHKTCFDFIYNFCLEHFSFYKEIGEISSKMYIGLQVKYLSFLFDFKET